MACTREREREQERVQERDVNNGTQMSKTAASKKRLHRLMIYEWIADNRGALSEIAGQIPCSYQFVSMVLKGERKSKDGRVEGKLKEMGAPVARPPVARPVGRNGK